MGGLLLELGYNIAFYAALTVVLIFLTCEVHERSHWLFGRIWTREITIHRTWWIFASYVNYHSPHDFSSKGMRISSVAPFIVGLSLTLLGFTLLDESLGFEVILNLPFMVAMILSPSDLLGIFFPERFQNYASSNDEAGHREMVRILIEEARK